MKIIKAKAVAGASFKNKMFSSMIQEVEYWTEDMDLESRGIHTQISQYEVLKKLNKQKGWHFKECNVFYKTPEGLEFLERNIFL